MKHCDTCTCQPQAITDFQELAEWDWVQLHSDKGRRLHHLAETDWEAADIEWAAHEGTTACGRVANPGVIPGMGSRMSTPRCGRCCEALGYPRGVGSPKNDDICKALAKARIERLQSDALVTLAAEPPDNT